ncbi:histone deacetylase family protein [Parasulfitobacter algicola]|uniref:Histone deacetylase family protein n=1 Tax=Parasulfitobacter algicola TaxID=2614809 RepID=A0ABX2IUU0_9RHOB|nr:histone deacetylase family protein [Sulfitobacter algicola]NSX56674.1 histone deacetylase family protein [Sulfitobacter algicola]
MTTALITHPDCLGHITPLGHVEQVARLEYVLRALDDLDLQREKAPLVADDDIIRVHPAGHLHALREAAPDKGSVALDPDTYMSPGTLDAVFRAAGACVKAVDMVMNGDVANAFCAVRPPGHHAEKQTPMGFCLLGNIAIAAKYALDHHRLARVAIVDFDVHHGNGTQDLLEADKRVFFASTHQMPLYPGTGHTHETGAHNNVLNIPLRAGEGSSAFRKVIQQQVFRAIDRFSPQLLLISAGFDAHADDPLAGLNLVEDDFDWVTRGLCDLADKHCGGRVVSTLEGGYDLDALAASAAAHVKVLMERGA